MTVKARVWLSFFLICAGLNAQTTVKLAMQEGHQRYEARQFDQALQSFNTAIALQVEPKGAKQSPELAMSYYARGLCYLSLKQYGSSTVDFNKAIYLDTALVEAYYNRSLSYYAVKNYHFALADVSRYIHYQSSDTAARRLRIAMAQQLSEYAIAESDAWFLFRLNGSESDLRNWIQCCTMGERWSSFQSCSDTALLEYSQFQWLRMDRAWVFHLQGLYERSNAELNLYGLTGSTDAKAQRLKADNYTYLGEYTKARELYLSLLEQQPNDANLWVDLGTVSLQVKEFARAERELTKAISMQTDLLSFAYLSRGVARYESGKSSDACQDWNRSHMLGEPAAAEYLRTRCQTKP
jgi:tetratricopeptide (TPR) repeat protein